MAPTVALLAGRDAVLGDDDPLDTGVFINTDGLGDVSEPSANAAIMSKPTSVGLPAATMYATGLELFLSG